MFVYIDAMFKGSAVHPSSPSGDGGCKLYTTDDSGVRNIPPYLLSPAAVMVARSDGNAELFDDADVKELMTKVAAYLAAPPLTGNETLVGWYLDQTVIPVLAANAMMCGVKIPPRLLRRMDDKWAKVAGHSVERAFWQGWFAPPSKEPGRWEDSQITLDMAMTACGMESLEDIAESLGDDLPKVHAELASRVAAISKLYTRYQNLMN